MTGRPNILVLCGRNKKRSRTAEFIFKNDKRFNIRSAGLSPKSARKLTEQDLKWSNLVFVMEQDQKLRVKELYYLIELPQIVTLGIPDDYEFMDAELVEMLESKINEELKLVFKI